MLIKMPAQLNWQSTRLVSGRLSVRFRRLAPLKLSQSKELLTWGGSSVGQNACLSRRRSRVRAPSIPPLKNKDASFSGPIVQWLGQETFNLLTRVRFPMGPPKSLISTLATWVISSVGQSICLTSRGSQVRVLYHPPFKLKLIKYQFSPNQIVICVGIFLISKKLKK